MAVRLKDTNQKYYWNRQFYEKATTWIYEALLLILLCGFFVAGVFYGLEIAGTEPELEWVDYVVQPGDTLWGIAKNVQSQPVDKTIWMIRQRNGIDALIKPGQVLLVPTEPERKVK